MKFFALATALAGVALVTTGVAAAVLPMDAPVKMGDITAVCSGVGSDKDSNSFASYPIRLEFSNSGAQFVSNEHVKLMNNTGAVLAEFDCQGPWVLLQLPKGLYSVTASIAGSTQAPATVKFSPPPTGQKRVGIQFRAEAPNQ